jgi:hypothetical protein
MTITKALRKLYKVIVGEEAPANANTITKVLLALAEAWTGSGGGCTEPLIIHVTEEEVKDPQTQNTIGLKTDTLASDVYEAWQNGRPIYYNIGGDEWTVSSVAEGNVVIIYWKDGEVAKDSLFTPPFADGYLAAMRMGNL